ncbi:MAG TPA: TonB family protein [Terriglobales bacterium]|nr:TonB family protein [Terriglobales bacterium]
MFVLRRWRKLGAWQAPASTLCVALTFLLIGAGPSDGSEYQVKAAYVYNFAKAAHWSAQALAADSNLVIGVLGGDEEFVKVLRDTLSNKSINRHSIEIRHLRSPEEIKFCHLVFFRSSERNARSIIANLNTKNVLLVGEDKQFLSDGGMINLDLENGKVSYEINSAALRESAISYEETLAKISGTDDTEAIRTESTRRIMLRVNPEYPEIAARMRLAGSVQLQAIVRADGTVKQVKVVGGHPMLAAAAANAVKQWRYETSTKETTEVVKISFGQ